MNLDNKKTDDEFKTIHLKIIKISTDILDKFISVNY
jgi:hypothetical protein